MLLAFLLLTVCFHASLLAAYEIIAAGAYHTLIVDKDGNAFAVGRNNFGQLGDGRTTQRPAPVPVMQGVQTVAAGRHHSIFVKNDGTAWATGSNSHGQLGSADSEARQSHPIQVMQNVRRVAAGDHHTLFVTANGAAYAVGDNRHGQLGDGTLHSRASPVKIFASGVQDVAAGSFHSLFVMNDSSLFGAGANFNGQLGGNIEFYCGGNCTFPESHFQVLHPVKMEEKVRYAVAGGNSTSFLDTDGVLWMSGENDLGQLCREYWGSVNTFMPIFIHQKHVALGVHHSVTIGEDGTACLCGLNSDRQLGYPQQMRESVVWQGTPVEVLSDMRSAAVGEEHTVFLDTRGQIWASGNNMYGQIGNWTMPASLVAKSNTTFLPVPSTTAPPKIVVLSSATVCGVVLLFIGIGVFSVMCGSAAATRCAKRMRTIEANATCNGADAWNEISGIE